MIWVCVPSTSIPFGTNSLTGPKIAILVVAYNAEDTLRHVLDRIPTEFAQRVSVVLVCDDASTDSTHSQALKYQQGSKLPLNIVRHAANLGYGGNQKFGYRWAIDNGVDIVVLLHGDGQYAPVKLPELLAPFFQDDADAVFGSRMIHKQDARKGGMPLYKFVGNKILTTLQNRLANVSLTEWHSGYRAYSVAALRKVNFLKNSDYFDFDSQKVSGDKLCPIRLEILIEYLGGGGNVSFLSSLFTTRQYDEMTYSRKKILHSDVFLIKIFISVK